MVGKIRKPASSNPNFITIQDIFFTETVLNFHDESVLLYDSGNNDPNRFLIFSNSQLQQFASNAKKFQMDGTFTIAPKCFNNGTTNNSGQMYSIQARREEILIPVLYILMYKRTFQEYERVFNAIINKTKLRVESVMLDFELGAIKAVEKYTPIYGLDLLKKDINEPHYMKKFMDDRHRMVFNPGKPTQPRSKIPIMDDPLHKYADSFPIYMPSSCNIK
ncbi:MAG: hypothetical protein MHPSP_002919 [Paramarteilia canceri]